MKLSSRVFIILWMTLGIVALMGTIERVVAGSYTGALLSILLFAFCAFRAYDTMQKDPGKDQ